MMQGMKDIVRNLYVDCRWPHDWECDAWIGNITCVFGGVEAIRYLVRFREAKFARLFRPKRWQIIHAE